eukprot:gene36750-45336_t
MQPRSFCWLILESLIGKGLSLPQLRGCPQNPAIRTPPPVEAPLLEPAAAVKRVPRVSGMPPRRVTPAPALWRARRWSAPSTCESQYASSHPASWTSITYTHSFIVTPFCSKLTSACTDCLRPARLIAHLALHGYIQEENVSCLFRHAQRGTMFTLVVDDFAVKYKRKEDADHFIATLKLLYELK